MTHTASSAARHELTQTAAALRMTTAHVHHAVTLLVPPGRDEWAGKARDRFSGEVEELWRRVILAGELMGTAARLCDVVAGEG